MKYLRLENDSCSKQDLIYHKWRKLNIDDEEIEDWLRNELIKLWNTRV